MLPTTLIDALQAALDIKIDEHRYCAGGDINNAVELLTSMGRFFVKWNPDAPHGMFSGEASGLKRLKAATSLKVPAVVFVHEATPGFLVLEWLASGRRQPHTLHALGRGLAELHQSTAPLCGLDHDNFIGSLAQSNQQNTSWARFYANQRIGVQLQLALENDKLTSYREQRLHMLIENMESLVPAQPPLSLLHGDLWGGNYMTLQDGSPALIDPAVYYGHAEIDIAMTELFGGFGAAFYDAYWYHSGGDRIGYEARRSLYQLYPLMVHMNLFGGGYTRSVDAILDRYVS